MEGEGHTVSSKGSSHGGHYLHQVIVCLRNLTSSVLGEGLGLPVSSLKGDQGPWHAFCHPSDWGAAHAQQNSTCESELTVPKVSIRKWGEDLQGRPQREDQAQRGVSLPSPVGSAFRVGGGQDLQVAGKA